MFTKKMVKGIRDEMQSTRQRNENLPTTLPKHSKRNDHESYVRTFHSNPNATSSGYFCAKIDFNYEKRANVMKKITKFAEI